MSRSTARACPCDPDLVYVVLNKPIGVVTTSKDPQGREDLRAYFPKGARVFPVGRLDRDTRGPAAADQRRRAGEPPDPPALRRREGVPGRGEGSPPASGRSRRASTRGVELEDGPARARSARVAGRSKGRAAVAVVMTEGRKREVRRLLAAVGLPVTRLVRTRIGPVRLRDLPPGEARTLTDDEVRALFQAAGL